MIEYHAYVRQGMCEHGPTVLSNCVGGYLIVYA